MNDALKKYKEKQEKINNIQNNENRILKDNDERVKKLKEQLNRKQNEIDELRDQLRKKDKEHHDYILEQDKWKEMSLEN